MIEAERVVEDASKGTVSFYPGDGSARHGNRSNKRDFLPSRAIAVGITAFLMWQYGYGALWGQFYVSPAVVAGVWLYRFILVWGYRVFKEGSRVTSDMHNRS